MRSVARLRLGAHSIETRRNVFLVMLTKQQLLDHAYKKSLTLEHRCVTRDGICVWVNEEGETSFLGSLAENVDNSLTTYELIQLNPHIFNPLHTKFIILIESIHDQIDPSMWKVALYALAMRHGLKCRKPKPKNKKVARYLRQLQEEKVWILRKC